MIVVKEKLNLIKDQNILSLSESVINNYEIEKGPRKFFIITKMMEDRIRHFTKDVVLEYIANLRKRENLKVVNFDFYSLSVSYNKPTDNIIINIIPLGSRDLSKIDDKNIYAVLTYALLFYNLVTRKVDISINYAPNIISLLLGILMRLFGKEYGLLGIYSDQIPRLNFLISNYVLVSFFGMDKEEAIKKSSTISRCNLSENKEELLNYDFYNIDDFIKSLDYFKVMPGINKYSFLSKVYKLFGYSFIPALEDCSRFMCTILTSSLIGSNVVPTFISKYNEHEFATLLNACKELFRKIQ